ncbi:uncharacterized protein LOC111696079 isoform X2 [Eurytemora carolleeae]|uniref:uncharacterized protein LOC111696079 isoform X2 n=1 Tax=Eurytemora carolleeae TaxID=1294199 RepID=UPI000C78E11F|nr:uncharacterized protein LOC111696079 isoform X2 [Eurytemora carolleeae]|eukprot:XP_023321376.1 uncharacterized protein LOC111696079 isoform X2 [Eurytemora affinis]
MSEIAYGTAVIGAGMIGSAAARYLPVGQSDRPNILIGPIESQSSETGVYGAWFDEGRITRVFDISQTWRNLAKFSIERYREIERESGISFFSEVGYLTVVRRDYNNMEKFQETAEILREEGYRCEYLEEKDLSVKFPYLKFPPDVVGFYQPDKSGYLNPRSLIRAEQELASARGVVRKQDVVVELRRIENRFHLLLGSGERLVCNKVLLATGAYINISDILQDIVPDLDLELKLVGQTVGYIQVSEEDVLKIKTMPNIITSYESGELDGTYILPPIQYPDGNYYIKIGHHDKFERELLSKEDVENWYRSGKGDAEAVLEFTKFIRNLIPEIQGFNVSGGCCVTSCTKDKDAPLLRQVEPGYIQDTGLGGTCFAPIDDLNQHSGIVSL